MEHVSNNDFLVTKKLSTLMKKYSLPCIISLLVAALYNIVDQIFIANADYLGSNGNAANTVVFPLTVCALALAVMFGDGALAFTSISLGEGKEKEASKSIGNAILLSLISSIVLMTVYLIFDREILGMFGADVNETTYEYAKEYFFYITLGIPFYMFGQCMNPIIRSDGSPEFAMVSTLAGAIFNFVFDPVLIYGMKWGMMGAAVATIAGQVLTACLSFCYLCHMKTVKLEKTSFCLDFSVIRKMIPLGITSFLSQASLVISMAAVQNSCARYGAMDEIFGLAEYSQIPMAVLGIVMKFFQIVISISVGLAAGCIPIVGYNIGKKRNDRARELFTMLIQAEAVIGLVSLAIVEIFPSSLIRLFGASSESSYYLEFGIHCFRIYLCMMPLSCINKGSFIFLQALGKAKESSVISMAREIILGTVLPILLPVFMGLEGLLWSFPLADILTFILAVIIIRKVYRSLSNGVI